MTFFRLPNRKYGFGDFIMSLVFELNRISLRDRMRTEAKMTREEYIKSVFSQDYDFVYRSQKYYYRSDPDSQDDVLIARIGKAIKRVDNSTPDEKFLETITNTHIASLVFIDPTAHENGQLLAFERDSSVGQGEGILNALFGHINDSSGDRSYWLQISAVKSSESFWKAIDKYKGEITSVTFEFFAPNMFGGTDKFSKAMQDLRDIENGDSLTQTIKGKDLNLKTERVEEAWGYVDKGQGNVKAKAGRRKIYDSETHNETVTLDGVSKKSTDLLNSLENLAKRALGKK